MAGPVRVAQLGKRLNDLGEVPEQAPNGVRRFHLLPDALRRQTQLSGNCLYERVEIEFRVELNQARLQDGLSDALDELLRRPDRKIRVSVNRRLHPLNLPSDVIGIEDINDLLSGIGQQPAISNERSGRPSRTTADRGLIRE